MTRAPFRTAKAPEPRSSRRERTISPPSREFINIFGWKGKVFDAKAGFLRNIILPLGVKAIVARVYKDPSWLDGKECIVLDYSETSLVASHVRDEIREVEPGFYLGKVYWDKARLIDFSLDFRNRPRVNRTATEPRAGAQSRVIPQDRFIVVAEVPEDRVAELRALLATMTLPGVPGAADPANANFSVRRLRDDPFRPVRRPGGQHARRPRGLSPIAKDRADLALLHGRLRRRRQRPAPAGRRRLSARSAKSSRFAPTGTAAPILAAGSKRTGHRPRPLT